jgi:predicted small secreted protein
MRRAAAITVLVAAACLLAAGCSGPAVRGTGVMYTCCAQSVASTSWRPGQQLPVRWTRDGTLAPGQQPQTLTLSAVLTGPFSKAVAMQDATGNDRLHARLRAAAPQIRISRNPPRSPISVITIPAGAPPGWYDLEIRVGTAQWSVSSDSIVTVG